ncbi:MAG: CbtB domain-containing protein [Dongiaceae bacterium]
MSRLEQVANFAGTGVETKTIVAAVLAATLGVFILFGVGFAGPPVLHSAAHDTRHAIAFPCH